MPTLILGVLLGTYLNNPQFRALTDKTTKDFAGKAFDFVSKKVPEPRVINDETTDREPEA